MLPSVPDILELIYPLSSRMQASVEGVYFDPAVAFTIMNRWTQIKTDYIAYFNNRTVRGVRILFDGEQPTYANVFYETPSGKGVEFIDLSRKMLLDEPDKPLEF